MPRFNKQRFYKQHALALMLFIGLFSGSAGSNTDNEPGAIAVSSNSDGSLDIDGNGELDALTDGLVILRGMFGLSGSQLIQGAIGDDAIYTDSADIEARITALGDNLDIDKDGNVDALSDGLLILRYLFGLTDDPLTTGVVSGGAQRYSAADIEEYLLQIANVVDAETFSGKVIDGYVSGANIFIDQNFNFQKDAGEYSAITDSNGEFSISVDSSIASCLKSRPIIANVPVGAVDSTLGTVTQAYQMILPSINDTGSALIVISPFTNLLSDAVVQGKISSGIKDALSVSDGCASKGDSIASNITDELNQIRSTIESSLGISYSELLGDFIANPSNSAITETSAQSIASFLPYFKQLSDEFDAELTALHNKTINTDITIKKDSINSILADAAVTEIPLSFSAIYKTEPNASGWFIEEKIEARGARINKNGEIIHHTCFTTDENCKTENRELSDLRNASEHYFRTSSFLNNSYDPTTYSYILNIEDSQIVYYDVSGNPSYRTCIYQNWLYLTPVDSRENFTTNDRYNTGKSSGPGDADDCVAVESGLNESLFVALVDNYDDGTNFESIDVRITNPNYIESTFFDNKINKIYENKDSLEIDPLVQEIASIPRNLKDINILRDKISADSSDQIAIYWTKRNSSSQMLESARILISYDPSADEFTYGTYENSASGSEYTELVKTTGQQARDDLYAKIKAQSSPFSSEAILGTAAVTDDRTSITGKTVDGYISGATVFFDVNFNQRLDAGEYSGLTDEDGVFDIKINDADLECVKARPVVANIPVGAVDSSLGTVTEAYQMLLPSVNDVGSNQIVISPFSSLLSQAILEGKASSSLNEDLTVFEGCQTEGDSVADNISSQVQSLISTIETSFGVTWSDLTSDFIATGGTNEVSEVAAQKIASYFPHFKKIRDEISSDLTAKYDRNVTPNISLSEAALSSIFSDTEYVTLPLEFLSIYKTNPNSDGFYSIEEITTEGAKVSSSGVLSRYKCIYDDSSLCDTTILNLNSIGNGSKQYRRDSAVYKDDFTVDGVAGNFVIQGEESRGVRNENETYCESQEKIQFNGPADSMGINMEYRYGFNRQAQDIFDCSILPNYGPNLSLRVEKQGNNIPSAGDRAPVWALQFNVLALADTDLVKNKVFNIVDNDSINPENLIKEVASIPYKFSKIDEMRKLLKYGESAFYYYTPNSANTGSTRPFCTTTFQVSSVPRDDQIYGSCDDYDPGTVEYTPLVYSGDNLFGQEARDKMFEILQATEFNYDNMVGGSAPQSNILFEVESPGVSFYERLVSENPRDYKVFPRWNESKQWIDASLVGSEIAKASIDAFLNGNYTTDSWFSMAINVDAPYTSTQDFKLQVFSNDNYQANSAYLEVIVTLKIETTDAGAVKVSWLDGDSVTFKIIDGTTELSKTAVNDRGDRVVEIPNQSYIFEDFDFLKSLLDRVRGLLSEAEMQALTDFFVSGSDYSYKIDLGSYAVLDDFDKTSSIIAGVFGVADTPSNSVYSYYQRFDEGDQKSICFEAPWIAEDDITFDIVPIYEGKPGFIESTEASFSSTSVLIGKGTQSECVTFTASIDDAFKERQEFLYFDIQNVSNAASGRNIPIRLTIEDMGYAD